MKKWIAAILILCMAFTFSSCTSREEKDNSKTHAEADEKRMDRVASYGYINFPFAILKDRQTGVCYLCANEGVCVMYNADGTVLTE